MEGKQVKMMWLVAPTFLCYVTSLFHVRRVTHSTVTVLCDASDAVGCIRDP
jgi:hypothetical protein